MSNGRVQTQTVYLTEAEFPEVFAKQDELLWVLRRSARLREEE